MTYHGVPVYLPKGVPWDVFKQLVRGHYEQAEQVLIQKYLSPNLPVIELGGSMGVVSAYVRTVLNPTTPMTVVEANPKLIPVLERNAFASDNGAFTRVLHHAVSTTPGSLDFPVSDDYLSNRISAKNDGETVSVQTITLGQLTESLDQYSLIMDIEGAEFDIFKNDAPALKACQLAIVEVHPHYFDGQPGYTENDFIALAGDAGLVHIETSDNVLVFKQAKQAKQV
ncbi:MAG: FkbM family methyltransferase [Burkholderiaceae bacterium]